LAKFCGVAKIERTIITSRRWDTMQQREYKERLVKERIEAFGKKIKRLGKL
jgi:hypothetical protein